MSAVFLFKKFKVLFLVVLAYLAILILSPVMAIRSVGNSMYYLVEMLQVLPVIFLLTVSIEALVPKEMIIRGFGEKSGFKGNLLSLLLGSISAGPIYAAFPISKTLLGKGASISNIAIILSTWAVIKVPMLANEAKFLGVSFMAVRWVLTVSAIFVMAYIIGILVKHNDLPTDRNETRTLEVMNDYCIGCGICSRILPGTYEMNNNKAVVIKIPEGEEAQRVVQESIDQCPAKAIIWNEEDHAMQ